MRVLSDGKRIWQRGPQLWRALSTPATDSALLKTRIRSFKEIRPYLEQKSIIDNLAAKTRLVEGLIPVKKHTEALYAASTFKNSKNKELTAMISYAWPILEDHPEEWWVQEFLVNFAKHLVYIGIEPRIDFIHSRFGSNTLAFMKDLIADSEVILPIGTRSFVTKMHLPRYTASMIRYEFSAICERMSKRGKEQLPHGVMPIQLTGRDIHEVFIPPYKMFSAAENFQSNSYLGLLRELSIRVNLFLQDGSQDLANVTRITSDPEYPLTKIWNEIENDSLLSACLTEGSEDAVIAFEKELESKRNNSQQALIRKLKHPQFNQQLDPPTIQENLEISQDKILQSAEPRKPLQKFDDRPPLDIHFWPRNELLMKLNELFNRKTNSNEPKIAILQGPPGVGKTQFASWYTKKFKEERSKELILWLNGDALISSVGGYFQARDDIITNYIDELILEFPLYENVLVIFDNLNHAGIGIKFYHALARKNPKNNIYTIITSNLNNWGDLQQAKLPIGGFDWETEGNELLAKEFPQEKENILRRVFYKCDGFPILLVRIIDGIKRGEFTLDDILQHSHAAQNRITNNLLHQVINPKVSHLITKSPTIALIIKLLSFIDCDVVSIDFLWKLVESQCASKNELRDLLIQLGNDGSIIRVISNDTVMMHSIFRRFIRNEHTYFLEKRELVSHIMQKVIGDTRTIPEDELNIYANGLITVIKEEDEKTLQFFLSALSMTESLLKTLEKTCNYQYHLRGDYNRSAEIAKFGLRIIEHYQKTQMLSPSSLSSDELRRLEAFFLHMHYLNQACLGNLILATEGIEKYIKLLEKPTGKITASQYAEVQAYLGFFKMNLGLYDEALDIFSQASKLLVQWKSEPEEGDKRSTPLTAFISIGCTVAFIGKSDFNQARSHALNSMRIYKSCNDKAHYAEANFMFALSQFYEGSCKIDSALMKTALEKMLDTESVFKQLYMNGHADLAETQVWIAWVFFGLKQLLPAISKVQEAKKYYQESGDMYYPKSILAYILEAYIEDRLGSNLDNVAKALDSAIAVSQYNKENSLGKSVLFGYFPPILWGDYLDEINNPVEYYKMFYEKIKILFGENHPQTMFNMFRLARSYVLTEQPGKARLMYEKIINLYPRVAENKLEQIVGERNFNLCQSQFKLLLPNRSTLEIKR